MNRVTFGIRVLASPRHAPLESYSRIRGAGPGVREGGAAYAAPIFLWGICTGGFIGDNCQIRRLEAVSVFGISLNTTCPDRFFFEISGCGMRGAGRCAADAARFFYGECAQAGLKKVFPVPLQGKPFQNHVVCQKTLYFLRFPCAAGNTDSSRSCRVTVCVTILFSSFAGRRFHK